MATAASVATLWYLDSTALTWKRRGHTDLTPPSGSSWTRKTGSGYVRYEDLYVSGDTIQQTISRLTTDAVVTFPPGTYTFSDFAVGTYFGIVIGSVGATHCKGLSGSGMSGVNATIFQMVPSSSSKSSYASGLGTSDTNLLHLITTTGQQTGVEFSGFHLRGTSQGHYYNGIHLQHNPGFLMDNVMISGIPGDKPSPPTECFALNILGAGTSSSVGVGNDQSVVQNCIIDGRLYDQTTNLPGSRVGSSLIGVNAVGLDATSFVIPNVWFKSTQAAYGLYGPLAVWHSFDLQFDDCQFGGRLNWEESGRMLYNRPYLFDPFGNSAVGQHLQQANSVEDSTFIAPTWVVGLAGAGGNLATHDINSAANPLIAHTSGGAKLSIYRQDESGFSTIVSR